MAYRDMVCMILFNYLFILIYAIYQQDVFNERSNRSRNTVFSLKFCKPVDVMILARVNSFQH